MLIESILSYHKNLEKRRYCNLFDCIHYNYISIIKINLYLYMINFMQHFLLLTLFKH